MFIYFIYIIIKNLLRLQNKNINLKKQIFKQFIKTNILNYVAKKVVKICKKKNLKKIKSKTNNIKRK